MQTKLTIKGRPYTKKNSQQIFKNKRTKKSFITQSQQYKQYEKDCLWQLKSYHGPTYKDKKLHVKCEYWMPNWASWPDKIGLMQATWDIIEKAGIIDDDKNIVNSDGSRIMGVDKSNPRVNITIEDIEWEYKEVE